MSKARVLVVFYSRSGTTRRLARQIAESLDADLEEIHEPRHRAGFFGYVRSANDALRTRECPITPPRRDPSLYDLVVIGTPVWMGRPSAPVQAYMAGLADRCRRVAFFGTYASRVNLPALFGRMARACGQEPLASLGVKQIRLQGAARLADVGHFATAIRTRLRLQGVLETEAFRLAVEVMPLRVRNAIRARWNRPVTFPRFHARAAH